MATRKRRTWTAIERWEQELPPVLRDYARLVRRQLTALEKQVERARNDASYRLGLLEERGEGAWDRLTAPYRREAVRVLRLLEKALAPAPAKARRSRSKAAKKKATKKKATKKKATRRKATKRGTRKKAAKRATKKAAKRSSKRATKKRKATKR